MIPAIIERCAGIDVGKTFLTVCLLTGPADGEPKVETRKVGTFHSDLEALRQWLATERCTHVVMESTGSYWKPVFNVLEASVTVFLVNGQDVKGRKGHKTDWNDCRWLAHLLRHGLVRPSFIPPRPVRELRDLTRRRKQVLSNATGRMRSSRCALMLLGSCLKRQSCNNDQTIVKFVCTYESRRLIPQESRTGKTKTSFTL